MDDMERYGDYNEIDEPPKGKSPLGLILKILIGALCVLVVGIIGFRIILFNYYPEDMKTVVFNDTLEAYYVAEGGNVGAKTQSLRFPYDDADKGRFFADHLVVVEGAGQLQITLRYNKSLLDDLSAEYGVTVTDESFSFRLARDPRENPSETLGKDEVGEVIAEPVGTLAVDKTAEFMMYKYHRLVFDGIDFGSEGGAEPTVEWLRVEVFIDGVAMEEPFMVLVYENNEANSRFTDYTLSEEELPR